MPGMFDASKPLPIPNIGENIINTQSDKVPFLKLVKKGKAPDQMLQSWPVESYPDVAFAGTLDGTDVTTYSAYSRDKLESLAMLLRTPGVQVSKLAQLTRDAGVPKGKEIAHQILKDQKVLGQMIERVLLSTNDHVAESGQTPYRTRGAFSWLNPSAQATRSVPAAYRPASAAVYTGHLDDFTADGFEVMLAAMAGQKKGAVDLKGIVGLKLKRTMSNWGQKVTASQTITELARTTRAAGEAYSQIIDEFEFDSGRVTTMLSFYLACTEGTGAVSDYSSRSGLFIDPSMWEIGYLQEPKAFSNPDLGGGPRAYHDAVFVLKCLNPLGQGYVLTNADS